MINYDEKIAFYHDEMKKSILEGEILEGFIAGCAANDLQQAKEETEALRKALNELMIATMWTAGSFDFHPEGQAYEGWQRLVQPALDQALKLLNEDY